MKATLLRTITLMAIACVSPQLALSQDNGWLGPGTNWATGGNWEFGVPTPVLDGRAVINVNPPVATVSTNVASAPTVVLGEGAGNSGALFVGIGGTLNVHTGVGDPGVEPGAGEGKVLIGRDGGLGTVTVSGSGKLLVAGEIATPSDGAAGSSLSLSGTAMVTAGSAFLDRNLSISGSTVSFSVGGDAIFGLAGTHSWTMPAAGSASTIQVAGNADLGGTLRVNFTGGTPTVGSTWNLINSATVDDGEDDPSGFTSIDQSGVLGLQPGQVFAVDSVAGGLGFFTQLKLEQHPVLLVNRQTGEMKLKNYGSTATVTFDHYSVRSPLGFLNVGDWTSLESQSIGEWLEANPTSTGLSEVEVFNTPSMAPGLEYNLGNAFDLGMPMQLGDVTEDLIFEFTKPGEDTPTQGQIVFTGAPIGNVVLTVDPANGNARLRNNSPFTVTIDTYAILSESGSLLPANGGWSSLDDQNTAGGDWIEANSSANQLSEIQPFNTTTLEPGTFYSLGTPFNINGKRDLTFQYALADEDEFRQGIVNYAALPSIYSADFDGDGDVDGADLTAWEASYSVNAAADANFDAKSSGVDFLAWQRQFGSVTPPLSATVAVPEPAAFLLLSWSWIFGLLGRRRRVMAPVTVRS